MVVVLLLAHVVVAAVAQKSHKIIAAAVLLAAPALDHIDVFRFSAEMGSGVIIGGPLADIVYAEIVAVNEQVDRTVLLIQYLRHGFRSEGSQKLIAEKGAVGIFGAAAQHKRAE